MVAVRFVVMVSVIFMIMVRIMVIVMVRGWGYVNGDDNGNGYG